MTRPPERQGLPKAPDPILGELWEVKREINKAADYRIDRLVDMANRAAERVRAQWRQEGKQSRPAP
ncbi:MAG: hypothetical protein WBJ41_12455 [Chromatiaceae bacterium]